MKTWNWTLLFVISMEALGCATANTIRFNVDSTPEGAQVDVNGVAQGVTPLQVGLQCSKRWVGVFNAPDGWEYDRAVYEVTAYPPRRQAGISQTKRVNACEVQNGVGHLVFDLRLQPLIPRQQIDLNVGGPANPSPAPPAASTLETTLKNLKQLRDQGLLSDDEYRTKVDQAIEKAK